MRKGMTVMDYKKLDAVLQQVLAADKKPERKLNEAILSKVEENGKKLMCSK